MYMAEEKVVEKEFRIQNKWLALTYKGHINKVDLQEFIQNAWPKIEITRFECAHETGKDDPATPYEHTHVGVEFRKAVASRNARILDYNGVHPFFGTKHGPIKSKKMFNDWLGYMSKEDPECSHLKDEGVSLFDKVSRCETLQDALRMAGEPGHVLGIKMLYDCKDEPMVDEVLEQWQPWGWQLGVNAFLETHPDERSIDICWEPNGCRGKTKYQKWLCYHWPKHFLVIQGMGYYRDMVQVIANGIKSGWNGHAVLINLPRDFEDKGFLWQTLEAIKDGLHTTQKYNGGSFMTPCPHVVLFANFVPKQISYVMVDRPGGKESEARRMISADRVRVHEIVLSGEDPNVPPVRDAARLPVLTNIKKGQHMDASGLSG